MRTRRFRGWQGPRGALLLPCLISLALCAGCGAVHALTRIGLPRPLVIATDGPPSAVTAPIYEAQANGDFSAGVLTVSIAPEGSGTSALAALADGKAQIAIATEPEILAANDSGAKLVAIGALEQGSLEALIASVPPTLKAPPALAGHSVATDGSALASAELDTVLASAGVPKSSVSTVTVTGNLDTWLEQHRGVTTLGGYWNLDPAILTQAHVQSSVIELANAGMPTFSDVVVVVRLNEAHYDGALLRAFLQSLTRGEIAVLADAPVAAATLYRANPNIPRTVELAALKQTSSVAEPANTSNPFGYQNPLQWQKFGAWMTAHGLLHNTANAGLAITDEFLPGEGE
jgi:hypothetical protein